MRLITEILAEVQKGRPIEEASEALRDVVKAVEETGKPGSVTLTITVTAPKKGPGKIIAADVKCKKPLAEIQPSMFLDDEWGDLMPMPGPVINGSKERKEPNERDGKR
jgi:hypothetical protein